MPRIDPIQLLKCLSVLLSPNGGIKSSDEVNRLAHLMTKFSKKLVSKCIYIQILKCTVTDLLGLFMGSGGWRLVHMWLTESIVAKNWPLVRELLELLILCPVDVERLKTNNCPKLVKELSKDGNHFAIRALASKLVEQWLKAVKGEHVTPILIADIPEIILDFQSEIKIESIKNDVSTNHLVDKPTDPVIDENNVDFSSEIEKDSKDLKIENNIEKLNNHNDNIEEKEVSPGKESDILPVLKITLKNGKQVLTQIEEDSNKTSEDDSEKEKIKEKQKSKSRDKSLDKSNISSSSRSSSSKHSSKSSEKSRSSSHKDSSSKHSSKDSKDKYKDKEKHSSHSSKSKSSSSSSSSKKPSSSSSSKSRDGKSSQKHSSDKNKSREKDKDTKLSSEKSEEKALNPSIQKLGKIPKLSDVKKERPSISIEVRKPDEPKPKTVKTFHSKFRKHGLEEEVKPPPSRASILNKKPLPPIPPTVSIPKRPSPVYSETPPEKKPKTLMEIDKPGAIKLIPPKPKRTGSMHNFVCYHYKKIKIFKYNCKCDSK